ncbi:hypothetical protein QAD02_020208 [Eretmocerus hayati]|uniref:Uncharacterized protein n=1 Tax=Eretmocerus hayati TaxID=131215 RepID=A0ACC2PNN3_9HYME|nr:hypothetical protein QAD02_020208 [Eretmocerus hayati]
MKFQFTRKQWLILAVICLAEFANSACISLQAPFYPNEARKKGATPTEHGLVFGIFELVVFLTSPVYGKNINRIGSKILFSGGILITGSCVLLFGLLDRIDNRYAFIGLSLAIRAVEALGSAAFFTASSATIAGIFPSNVATLFSTVKTFFGLGLIVGPTIGGALYELKGYTLPFAVLGSVLLLIAIATAFILPDGGVNSTSSDTGGNLKDMIRIPGLFTSIISIVSASISIGFISATLEPHLSSFNLPPLTLGLMFVVEGGIYALTAPMWGWICDRVGNAKVVTIVGCFLLMVGFSLVGPAPFIPSDTTIKLIICGLILQGLGVGAELVASFTDILRLSTSNGFSNNMETHGMVSGLWASSFALGAFIGPIFGGISYDLVGFDKASIIVVALHFIMSVVLTTSICYWRHRSANLSQLNELYAPMISSRGSANSKVNSHYGSIS